MAKVTNTTPEDVQATFTSLYSDLLSKRKIEKEEKEEERLRRKEEKRLAKEEKEKDGQEKQSKKEKREAELDNWKEIVVGLTGDDIEYSSEKRKKKKYRQWIDDDTEANAVLTEKVKKPKKRNYNKEFEAELNMLKRLVADQNRFTADLQKRFNIMIGPNNKDAMPLNKTQVELASVLINSRSNSLGVLKEIGNLKKTIADLYMRQKKLDSELGGSGNVGAGDIGLMGSNIAALLGDSAISSSSAPSSTPTEYQVVPQQNNSSTVQATSTISSSQPGAVMGESFDPSTWDGDSDLGSDNYVLYENIPHTTVVEWVKSENKARFKAIRDDNGEELIGCPVPTTDPSRLSFNEKDMLVRGEFDETYKLEII